MIARKQLFVLIAAITLIAEPAAAQSCGCEVSDAKEQRYDKALRPATAERNASLRRNLPYGVPVTTAGTSTDLVLVHKEFVIGYDPGLRVPIWTGHRLTRANLATQRPRTECFRRDKRVPADSAGFCADYDEPVFDRGHMVPNSDMERGEEAMINTYMFSNMTPQHCAFNRGIWQALESVVRHWVKETGTLYIITGSVFDSNGDGQRDAPGDAARMRARNGTSRVAVPTHFYKALFRTGNNGHLDTLVVMLPNVNRKVPEAEAPRYLEQQLTSIAAVERLTNLNLMPITGLSPAAVRATKEAKAAALWPLPENWPRHLDSGC